jgi:hypothetical protein
LVWGGMSDRCSRRLVRRCAGGWRLEKCSRLR